MKPNNLNVLRLKKLPVKDRSAKSWSLTMIELQQRPLLLHSRQFGYFYQTNEQDTTLTMRQLFKMKLLMKTFFHVLHTIMQDTSTNI